MKIIDLGGKPCLVLERRNHYSFNVLYENLSCILIYNFDSENKFKFALYEINSSYSINKEYWYLNDKDVKKLFYDY